MAITPSDVSKYRLMVKNGRNGVPSKNYVFFLPCQQIANTFNLIDQSGQMNDALFNSAGQAESAYWANKGYVTVAGGSNNDFRVPQNTSGQAVTGFDLAANSFIAGIQMNMAIPAASFNLFGNGSSAGPNQGFYISVRITSGKVRPVVIHSGGQLTGLADSTQVFCDSSDHFLWVIWDHINKDIILGIDEVISNVYPNVAVANTAAITSAWSIGSDVANGATTATTCKVRGHHLLKYPNGLPANALQLVKKLARNPLVPIMDFDQIIGIAKRIFIAILGQSNEVGNGTTPSQTRDYGAAHIDPILPNGSTKRSMWPQVAERMGRRGMHARFYNTGIGATSIANSWVGICRAWANNMVLCKGSYVLNAGNVYRLDSAESGNVYVSTVAPTGGADITTGDGLIWKFKAAARAQDVDGYVYPYTDAYFDPLAHIAAMMTGFNGAVGFDEKIAYISIGQTDKSCGTTAAQYTAAIQSATNYFLSQGIKVMIGFTCYGASAGLDAAFTSQSNVIAATPPVTNAQVNAIAAGENNSTLCYGWYQALLSYVGNANVIQGANLRYRLGVLPTTPAIGVAGVQGGVDNVHMNDAAYTWASLAVADAFRESGR